VSIGDLLKAIQSDSKRKRDKDDGDAKDVKVLKVSTEAFKRY